MFYLIDSFVLMSQAGLRQLPGTWIGNGRSLLDWILGADAISCHKLEYEDPRRTLLGFAYFKHGTSFLKKIKDSNLGLALSWTASNLVGTLCERSSDLQVLVTEFVTFDCTR